mmetsp:Transcript_15894/g.17635  ORF Transcript_15894/g.17635 Transcript_15894/m.17635 type:complete len:138 (+) Transcript_15894:19-432(+)
MGNQTCCFSRDQSLIIKSDLLTRDISKSSILVPSEKQVEVQEIIVKQRTKIYSNHTNREKFEMSGISNKSLSLRHTKPYLPKSKTFRTSTHFLKQPSANQRLVAMTRKSKRAILNKRNTNVFIQDDSETSSFGTEKS